jgi:hypothetical protein
VVLVFVETSPKGAVGGKQTRFRDDIDRAIV